MVLHAFCINNMFYPFTSEWDSNHSCVRHKKVHHWYHIWSLSRPKLNYHGLLGSDLQYICVLGWASPSMGGPRSDFTFYWYNKDVILALNFPSHGLTKVTITQPHPFPKFRVGSLCSLGGCFLTSLMLLSLIFPSPNPYSFFSIYSLPLVGFSWWGDFIMSIGPSAPYSWSKGTHHLQQMWLLGNLCMMPVTTRQANSPKTLSLVHGKLLGYLGQRFGRPLLDRHVG